MRARIPMLAALFLGGCAVTPRPQQASAPAEPELARYEEAPATALVFSTPLPDGEKPIELTRDERQPAAFVGFDGPITTSFWIYTDDLQSNVGGVTGWGDARSGGSNNQFQREAIMEQTGVRTR